MTGLIIAVAIMGTILVSAIIVGAIKLYTLEKNITSVGECLLMYMTHPESVDIIEDYDNSHKGINFPNNEGF